MNGGAAMSDPFRLVALARSARDHILAPDGQWRREAAAEAVRLMPGPEAGETAYHLQHAIRNALLALAEIGPGIRVQLGRALQDLAMALRLELHGRGFLEPRAEPAIVDAPQPYYLKD